MITIKSFEVNYFSENTYLLYDDTKEAVLIDCGCLRKEEQKEVSDFIAQNGLRIPYSPRSNHPRSGTVRWRRTRPA
jgi:hydroxyacylglutathione hydrolase